MTNVERVMKNHADADERMRRQAVEAILATPEGRVLYRWIEDASGVWDTDVPADEQERTAWIGKRALGVFLLSSMRDVALEDCLRAERERADVAATRNAELDKARHDDLSTNPNPQD